MKKLIIFVLTMILSLCLVGCDKASYYSDEEHEERVRKLVEKRYFAEGTKYESYELYPIYDENDKLSFFLVDFEPDAFVYIVIHERDTSWMYGKSMYTRCDGETWSRYKFDENNEIIYEKDDQDNQIYYECSHFKAANIKNEKRYLLYIEGNGYHSGYSYVPAVKRGDKFLNLMSMEEFYYKQQYNEEWIETSEVHFIPKNYFDL